MSPPPGSSWCVFLSTSLCVCRMERDWKLPLAFLSTLETILVINCLSLVTIATSQNPVGANTSFNSTRTILTNVTDSIPSPSTTSIVRTTTNKMTDDDIFKDYFLPEDFPTLRSNMSKCDRPILSRVCDPDRLLSPTDAQELHDIIESVQTFPACPCGGRCNGSYHILVAIVNKLKYEQRQRLVEPEKKMEATTKFAEYLRYVTWYDLAQCDDHAVVVYNAQDRMVATSIGSGVRRKLTYTCVNAIKHETQASINSNQIFTSLRYILREYKRVLTNQRLCVADPPHPDLVRASKAGSVNYTIIIIVCVASPFIILILIWIIRSCVQGRGYKKWCSGEDSDA